MGLFNKKSVQLSDSLNQATAQALDGLSAADEKELFAFAEYHPEDAEKTGFSGYSYWRSTLRVFTRNKMAMFLLGVIIVLLLFTFIQPYLPGQRDPIVINNDENGIQIINMKPNSEFWFGTNSIGQDLWSRVWSRYAHQSVHRLFRSHVGGRFRHSHRRAVGLCAQAGFLFYRAVQRCGQYSADASCSFCLSYIMQSPAWGR